MTAQLTFDDEFNSLSLWNGSSGTWSTSYHYNESGNGSTLTGNNEQEMYINANYAGTSSVKPWTVSNGVLTLEAAKASPEISAQINGYQYTSGMVTTYHSFAQQYGYFEMSAQLPAGQALWPAFWLMPTDGSWPPELDIMEVLGNDTSKLYTTVHTSETGSHTMDSQGTTVADMSSGYHTYAVDWEADKITFYFDNKQVYQVDTPADMHKPMYMIANLAVGGGWPGYVDGTTPLPADMNIDYIRAYDSNPYTSGGAPPTTGSSTGSTSGSTGSTGSTTGSTGSTSGSTGSTSGSSSGAGQTLTATHTASALTGGTGADTLIASQGADTLTGGAGADRFVFKTEPWSPIHITDFKVGTDALDLSALFKAVGYTGTDPIKDHYITLESDGAGGTLVGFEDHGLANINGNWPNRIIDLEHVSSNGLNWAKLATGLTASASTGGSTTSGSASLPTAPATLPVEPTTPTTGASGTAGQTLTATHVGSVLTGGAGADTLISSQASDTMTGGAGADRFVITSNPWAPIHVTDFQSGSDKIDLTALFKSTGYTGSNPVADHYVTVESDGAGGSLIRFEPNGLANINGHWPNTVIDLEHVAPSAVKSSDWIIH